ncbi:2-methylisocitrate lyase-like PEP mutase family enzyme [Nocardioides thalensis]|uniref:2-methylisocitrate lyase-like PEP mutase family enzyme n=1 Tax=Nocardioides thalensis TaxID=1914755 RepID=A0A853C2H0_9ACTN|nr:isocitrate lyase/phosphoenolpyruvate mutase family protein [Nocardioides thalensis]NYJ00543.1 2-methylisocitrate lyase-like PEP mutase family enzyme [Nocardioides thalensis]
MSDHADLARKAEILRSLHVPGDPVVLPNVWDVGSALAVVDAGFPVVATASNAVAAVLGYDDGEGAPVDEMFRVAGRIAASVDVPVTVDAEAGYGLPPEELVERLIALGVVGCNIEDSDHRNGGLVAPDVRAAYIEQMRAAADRAGVPIVINARVDSFFPSSPLADDDKLGDAVARGTAYRAAGADCVFPPGADPDAVRAIVEKVDAPVNGGLPLGKGSVADVAALGVARISLGPQLYRSALANLGRDLAGLR